MVDGLGRQAPELGMELIDAEREESLEGDGSVMMGGLGTKDEAYGFDAMDDDSFRIGARHKEDNLSRGGKRYRLAELSESGSVRMGVNHTRNRSGADSVIMGRP
jgi:hypothetical protein